MLKLIIEIMVVAIVLLVNALVRYVYLYNQQTASSNPTRTH